MSFSAETKNEIAHIIPEKKCCMLAEIAGFLRMNGSIGLAGGGKFNLIATTEDPAIARHYKTLIKLYFGEETVTEVGKATSPQKDKLYTMTISSENRSEPILRETGLLMIREGYDFISDGIYDGLIKSKCCKKAFLRGVFLSAGTVTNPNKGYHFEISTESQVLAKDIKKLLNSFDDIFSKITKRKKDYVIYIKDSGRVRDVLAIMGAHNKVLEFDNVITMRELRNKTNRINNCDHANINKAIATGERHIEAIKKIEETRGLDSLPEKLREVSQVRLENPDASLTEIGEMLREPIKKAGVSKRLAKIEEISKGI